MKSRASSRFWKLYAQLPENVRRLARKNYLLWTVNPGHRSLDFKELRGGEGRFSLRIGDHYRALGCRTTEGVEWVWIGSHEEYNKVTQCRVATGERLPNRLLLKRWLDPFPRP